LLVFRFKDRLRFSAISAEFLSGLSD